jgi:hypothetical protein
MGVSALADNSGQRGDRIFAPSWALKMAPAIYDTASANLSCLSAANVDSISFERLR